MVVRWCRFLHQAHHMEGVVVRQYVGETRKLFSKARCICLSADDVKLDGDATLIGVAWSPDVGKACYVPLQVAGAHRCP